MPLSLSCVPVYVMSVWGSRVACLVVLCVVALGYEDRCDGNWLHCRQNTIEAIFNASKPPERDPDFIIHDPRYEMSGLPGPGTGTGVGAVSWGNNMTHLIWTMTGPFLTLNTTVLYTLNTSGRAAANYNPPPYKPGQGPGIPPNGTNFNTSFAPQVIPRGISDTLLIYHNGHETATCTPNYDGVVDYFNELGYDVMEMMMPLIGCNQAYQYGNPRSHAWFEQWEQKGDYTMRYFIEPVALVAAYARKLGYQHVAMLGLSGGGWTTTVASAVITDIDISFPTAGSTPKWKTKTYPHWVPDLPEGRDRSSSPPDIFSPPPAEGAGGDYEQESARPMFSEAGGYLQMYIMAALEPNRYQLQVLHEFDSCCFRAAGLHSNITQYNQFAQQHVKGWFQTAVTAGNYHEINPRDKVIVATMIEKLRRKRGVLTRADFEGLPFDDLA